MENLWKHDLPEYFGPMTVKELRQSMRKAGFVYPFLAIQLVAVLAVSVELKTGGNHFRVTEPGMLNVFMLFESGPFWSVAGAICMLIMPLSGLWLMKHEVEEGNHELLQLTPLNRWGIVLGKFFTLWGVCCLTMCSLLPYVVVRYMVGGVEWWHELACAGTVLGGAAILSSIAIGTSAYQNTARKIGVFLLMSGSFSIGAATVLVSSAIASRHVGLLYHVAAITVVACYVMQGLALARAKLRLTLQYDETRPSGLLIGWLCLQPFAIGLVTAMSIGYGGFVGLLVFSWVAYMLDYRQKRKAPAPNIPKFPA
ncbi:MAG: hypothetical protein QM680_10885 [Luteolibacter sp.]